jgi:hypothetical protein
LALCDAEAPLRVGADGVSDWSRDELAAYAAALRPHMPIDMGIVRAVRILRTAGIPTFESCEGGPGHAFAEPTVRFGGTPETGWAALGRLPTWCSEWNPSGITFCGKSVALPSMRSARDGSGVVCSDGTRTLRVAYDGTRRMHVRSRRR